MDNADFNDQSSISGMHSDRVTMQVLFREIVSPPNSKPRVSETNLRKSTEQIHSKLPCQKVRDHRKSTVRPELPTNFVVLNIDSDNCESASALRVAQERELLISLVRCGMSRN